MKNNKNVITLRVNPDMYEVIKSAAAMRSMTVASYVKSVVSEALRKEMK